MQAFPQESSHEPPDERAEDSAINLAADVAFERALKAKRKPALPVSPTSVTTSVTITDSGTNSMGRPVLMEPISSAALLNNLVCREILDPSGELEPTSPTIVGLQATVKAISLGTDIAPYRDSIQRVAANQPEKSEVVRAYLNQVDHETLVDMVVMRSHSLRVIKKASTRNDVTVGEALVVWRMCNEQIPELKKGIGTNDKAVDSVTVVEKIDYQRQQAERSSRNRWEGTTPQGRELIRKRLWTLRRRLLAQAGVHPVGIEPPEPPPEEIDSDDFELAEPTKPVTAAHPI